MNNLSRHLKEAIVINRERLPEYNRLSNGDSKWVSRILIFSESILLPSCIVSDKIANFWVKRGVKIFEYEFVEMSEINDFTQTYPEKLVSSESLPKFPILKTQLALIQSFFLSSNTHLYNTTTNALEKLEHFPRYHCMARHLFESLGRAIYLKPQHINQAKKLSVCSPRHFCNLLIFSHILLLNAASFLDKLAFKTQKKNIPILYQDLPHIKTDISIY